MKGKKHLFTKKEHKVSKNIKKYVHKAIEKAPELKYSLVTYTAFACRATANLTTFFTCLTDSIPQGLVDNNARIGDQIKIKRLLVNFYMGLQKGVQSPDDLVVFRMIIFQWKDIIDTGGNSGSNLGAILPSGSIFLTGVGGATNSDPTSHYNHDRVRSKTLHILYDKLWHQENNSNAVNGANSSNILGGFMKNKKISLKFAQKHINFINNSTTQASGHIFVMILTNNVTAATNPIGLFSSKLEFTDA